MSWINILKKYGIQIEHELCQSHSNSNVMIFKGQRIRTSQSVVIKRYLNKSSNSGLTSHGLNEILFMSYFPENDHLLTLIDQICTRESLYLVYEYCDKRDIERFMVLNELLPAIVIQSFMFQLLTGLNYLHQRLLLHGDLQLKHLLIKSNGKLKIADFSQTRHLYWPQSIQTRNIGCLQNRCPELILGQLTNSTSIDIWSVACLLAQLCQNSKLFKAETEIELLFQIFSILGTPTDKQWPNFKHMPYYSQQFPQWIRRDDLLCDLTKIIGSQGCDLLLKLFIYDPKYRLTTNQALKHPYFQNMDSIQASNIFKTLNQTSQI